MMRIFLLGERYGICMQKLQATLYSWDLIEKGAPSSNIRQQGMQIYLAPFMEYIIALRVTILAMLRGIARVILPNLFTSPGNNLVSYS